MNKVFITGISGSGGSYLAEYILDNYANISVSGATRWHSTTSFNNLEKIKKNIKLYECDLTDLSSIIRTLQIVKPENIYHLAAFANVRAAFDTPLAVINNNVMGTANLLEACRLVCPECKIMMCSTSEVYGNPKVLPMTEEHPLEPVNPYSVSKLAGDRLAYCYFKSWGLPIITSRAFAYINPRRGELFSTAFAKQIALIEAGKQLILKHGNLDSIRTIIDVRDMCGAYCLLMERGDVGEVYNIGGTDVLTVGEFLDLLKDNSNCEIRCEQDPKLMRPVDLTRQICDATKFIKKTNWKPRYSIEDSIDFLLDHVRKEVINDSRR